MIRKDLFLKNTVLNTFVKPKMMMLITAIALLMTACNNNKNQDKMTTQNETSLFPKGEKLSNEWFSGNAFLAPLLARDTTNDFVLGNVTFEPKARTHWHTHPRGQVLIVTEGEGFNQEKGKPAQRIKKGDVINVSANVEHWHGATASSEMVHIAITNYKGEENVIWLQPVTDEEFNVANKQ